MSQPDYDLATLHWIESDRDSVHMEIAIIKEKNEYFVGAHNACAGRGCYGGTFF